MLPDSHRIIVLAALAWLGLYLPANATEASGSSKGAISLDTLQWRNIGPFRGGRATAIAGIAAQPYTFYMGTAGGGVYKTTDAGMTWSNVTDGFVTSASVGTVAVAPSAPNIVYTGMGEDTARANTLHSGDGVYKSQDAGKTWTHIGLEATQVISRILIDPDDANTVYVAAQGALYAPTQDRGVYRTTDGGKTWKRVFFVSETGGVADLAMDPHDSRTLYAAVWDHRRHPWALRQFGPAAGLYKSTDGGDSWEKIDAGLPEKIGKIAVAVSAEPDRIYALVQADPNSESGLYRSNDSGRSWVLVNSDANLTRRAFYFDKLFADPKDPDKLWISDLSLFRTTDGGKTFGVVKTTHGDHHEFWINPQNTRIVAEANDGGGTISLDDGVSWSSLNNQATAQFYRLSVDNQYPYRIYAAQQDNTTVGILSRSNERGIGDRDWYPVGGSESSFLDVDPNHPDFVYSSDTIGIFDVFSQATRTQVARPIHGAFAWGTQYDAFTKYRYSLNAPVFVSRHDPKKIYYAAQKLLLTTDRGKTWREVSSDLTHAGLDPDWDQHVGMGLVGDSNYDVLTYAAESPVAAGELWTGSCDGVVAVSRNGGASWHTSVLPAPAGDARVNAIDPSPFDPAVANVAATRFQYNDNAPYLFKTSDFGKTWVRIDSDLPRGDYTRVVRADTVRKGLLYAGTEAGVYVSFDDGGSWQPLQSKLPLTPITDLNAHGSDLIAATSGRAIWILDDLAPLRQMTPDVAQADVKLFQPVAAYRTVFGGDFAPTAQIAAGENPPDGAILDFYLRNAVPATIEILDSTGAVVRKLPGAAAKAGLQRAVWDLRYAPVDPMSAQIPIDGLVPRPRGRLADPGSYTVRLLVSGQSLSVPLTIRADPRWKETAKAYADQDHLLNAIDDGLAAIEHAAMRIHSAQTQIAAALKRTADPATLAQGKALMDELQAKQAALLYSHLAYLENWVNTAQPDVVASEREMYSVLHAKAAALKTDLDMALGADLDSLNAQLAKQNIPPIVPTTEATTPPPPAADHNDQSDDDDDD